MDRLRALEVFIEVADAGSLVGAARKLSLSPPSVTRILGEYEQDLGVALFHRTTRALTLTDDGQRFLQDARNIVAAYQDASDALKGAHKSPKGTLRLTAPTLFGQYYVLPHLLRYMDTYPDVKTEFIFLDRIVNLVEEGFDLAVRIGPLSDSSMIATRVGWVHRVVCGTPTYFDQHGRPESPQDLLQHKVVLSSAATASPDWVFRHNETVRVPARLISSSVPAAIAATKADWGITQTLSYQVMPDIQSGALERILVDHEPDPVPIHFVYPEAQATSAKVRAFIELAGTALRQDRFLNP